VNSLVDRFFEARKMMARMTGGMGMPGARRANSKNNRKGNKKGKNKQAGRGPSQPRMPAGMAGLPGGFGQGSGGLPGGFGQAGGGLPGLPPGTELPDLSKLKFPKS
jgi:signal recognition particle subunit SRP54